jgi:hypothetical protein
MLLGLRLGEERLGLYSASFEKIFLTRGLIRGLVGLYLVLSLYSCF